MIFFDVTFRSMWHRPSNDRRECERAEYVTLNDLASFGYVCRWGHSSKKKPVVPLLLWVDRIWRMLVSA